MEKFFILHFEDKCPPNFLIFKGWGSLIEKVSPGTKTLTKALGSQKVMIFHE